MRYMYDSTVAADITPNARMVAGYVDGTDPWSAADWARFPRAVQIGIARHHQTDNGDVGDCEPGLMTPADLVDWVRLRRSSGARPSGYCGVGWSVSRGVEYGWQACRAAFAAAGVTEPPWWVAHFDGHMTIPAGAVAKQFADQQITGGHYDLSAVADYWPGIDPPQRGDTMGLNTTWRYETISPTRGTAFTALEVGDPPSTLVTELYVGAKAFYGDLRGVVCVFTDDSGNPLPIPWTNQTIDELLVNQCYRWQAPAGASGVTIEYDPSHSTGLLSAYDVSA